MEKVPFGSKKYQTASLELIDRYSNGCGLFGKIMSLNMIAGVDVESACNAHDFEYIFQAIPRKLADDYFLLNLNWLIDKEHLSPSKTIKAKTVAKLYYRAVRIFGRYL